MGRRDLFVFLLLSCAFGVFFLLNERALEGRRNEALDRHSRVLSVALWDFDDHGSAVYLRVAAELEDYDHAALCDNAGQVFIAVEGPPMSRLDRALMAAGLATLLNRTVPVLHNKGQRIGELRVRIRNRSVYTYSYVLLLLLFIFLALVFFLRTLDAKRGLEARVKERTAEIAAVNAELSMNEKLLRIFKESVENSSDAVGMSTPEGKHFYQNRAFDELFGQVGENPAESVYVDHAVGQEVFRTIMAGGQWTGEVKMYAKDRRVLEILLRANANKDTSGRITALFGIHTDITNRKQAEAALRESEERFKRMINEAPLGIAILDSVTARFCLVNPALERITGRSREELERIDLSTITHPEDIEPERQNMAAMNAGKIPGFQMEKRFQYPDGRFFWGNVTVARMYVEDPSKPRHLLMLEDISERKRSEERLRQVEKMESIGQLAGGIAHDFNNQLTGILGYAELLEQQLHDPTLRHYAERIRTTGGRAAELTRQLLAFARQGKQIAVPMDLHKIIRETAALLERSIDKRITIRLRLEASPSVVVGDPAQLENALLNLGLNARDAMPGGGELIFVTTVEVLTKPSPVEGLAEGRFLAISVTDTGIGMDKATQKRIFEPFFTTKEIGHGTGLGLPSVYGTVKSHGGVIRVYSEPGRGSTFRIHLPLASVAAGDFTTADRAAGGLPHCDPLRILLVDDETVLREVGREILSDLGHTVTTCGDPSQALALYQRDWRRIDLVILDMVMPVMSGKELFLALRAVNPSIRALLCSGYAVNGEAQGILDAGVLGFVQKPYLQETIARKIAEVMGRGRP